MSQTTLQAFNAGAILAAARRVMNPLRADLARNSARQRALGSLAAEPGARPSAE